MDSSLGIFDCEVNSSYTSNSLFLMGAFKARFHYAYVEFLLLNFYLFYPW